MLKKQILGAQENCGEFAEDVVIEDRVVKSTVEDLQIPDVDFATFLRNTWKKEPDAVAIVSSKQSSFFCIMNATLLTCCYTIDFNPLCEVNLAQQSCLTQSVTALGCFFVGTY